MKRVFFEEKFYCFSLVAVAVAVVVVVDAATAGTTTVVTYSSVRS